MFLLLDIHPNREIITMQTKPAILLSLILLLILTSSCGAANIQKDIGFPDIGIPAEELNTRVVLTAPDGWNTFNTEDAVSFLIEIKGSDPVSFSYSTGVKLFFRQGDQWIEVENTGEFPQNVWTVEPANGDRRNLGSLIVWPELPDDSKEARLLVILIGNMDKGESSANEQTAGYIILHLNPD
jgi:hypothetical protein